MTRKEQRKRIKEAQEDHKEGLTPAQIATKYGMSLTWVYWIIKEEQDERNT